MKIKVISLLLIALLSVCTSSLKAEEGDSVRCDTVVTDIFSPDYPDLINNDYLWLPFVVAKSNILFDAASLINIGLEVPIGYEWSVAGDYYFPWWKSEHRNITIQCLAGIVEARRWLGDFNLESILDRRSKPVMEGFYVGAYMGAGYYDFQLGGDGIQGEFFLMGGLSGGYVHRISKSLRLEYNLGIGFLRTNYREYSPVNSEVHGDIKAREYPWPERRQTWLGPTKAQISLQWLINGDTFKKLKGWWKR